MIMRIWGGVIWLAVQMHTLPDSVNGDIACEDIFALLHNIVRNLSN